MKYHFMHNEQIGITEHQLEGIAKDAHALKSLKMWAAFLNKDSHILQLMARNPLYTTFYIPKKNGERRLIQNPADELKKIQRKLAHIFQAIYYPLRPDCSFGFLVSPLHESEHNKRNIYTNAIRHSRQKFVLNIDLKDFFHQVKTDALKQIFMKPCFDMTEKTAHCFALLCTYEGRLAMGAPTSPILSNFACIELDAALIQWAKAQNRIYTRYVDDLTFSGKKSFSPKEIDEIKAVIARFGFEVNPKKIKVMHKKTPPEVTGLILKKKKPDVSPGFLKGIKNDIIVLEAMLSERMLERNIFKDKPFLRLKQTIAGELAFLAFIRGEDDKTCQKLKRRVEKSGEQYQL